eukprot:Cvel_31086.t2-p1 / transcript=Cvel_31086.t2 / gene=Cvel_31086 / organism=Chromera_velia_CCMP2878 / gene_product=hypothetical protein / transcript_product=hypothetical protein / location=Cvel_scaffold4561:2649-3131(-) / protein_length=161 / sequence_SO=supercontig / SO=protein_coding / is_pseudo=false
MGMYGGPAQPQSMAQMSSMWAPGSPYQMPPQQQVMPGPPTSMGMPMQPAQPPMPQQYMQTQQQQQQAPAPATIASSNTETPPHESQPKVPKTSADLQRDSQPDAPSLAPSVPSKPIGDEAKSSKEAAHVAKDSEAHKEEKATPGSEPQAPPSNKELKKQDG